MQFVRPGSCVQKWVSQRVAGSIYLYILILYSIVEVYFCGINITFQVRQLDLQIGRFDPSSTLRELEDFLAEIKPIYIYIHLSFFQLC